jgi:probable DNA metabolism protein
VIHDYERNKAAFFDGSKIYYAPVPEKIEIVLSESETRFKSVWKNYHKNLSVTERQNLKLQRAFAPIKYRHFMSEFDTADSN